jgi:hypothetical protein
MQQSLFLAISVMAVQGSVSGLTITSASFYQLAMIGLSLGSPPMCLWLIRSKFVPAMLGALDFVGYLCLVAATIACAIGSETVSMALLFPGAVFTLVQQKLGISNFFSEPIS